MTPLPSPPSPYHTESHFDPSLQEDACYSVSTPLRNAWHFELPNRIRCALVEEMVSVDVSNTRTAQDAVDRQLICLAICIGVGQLQDPEEVKGLAHLVEHMLFLGSAKYPEENYLRRICAQRGGRVTKATTNESISITIEVAPDLLATALDVIGDALARPLLSEGCFEREIALIEKEHQANIPNEKFRVWQLLRDLANPAHPLRSFGFGNEETLTTLPIPALRDRAATWISSHFYAQNISVCATFFSVKHKNQTQEKPLRPSANPVSNDADVNTPPLLNQEEFEAMLLEGLSCILRDPVLEGRRRRFRAMQVAERVADGMSLGSPEAVLFSDGGVSSVVAAQRSVASSTTLPGADTRARQKSDFYDLFSSSSEHDLSPSSEPLFPEQLLPVLLHVKLCEGNASPATTTHAEIAPAPTVMFAFPINGIGLADYEGNTLQLVSHYLQSVKEGSILSILNHAGLAMEGETCIEHRGKHWTLLTMTISLTEAGDNDLETVMVLFLRGLALFRDALREHAQEYWEGMRQVVQLHYVLTATPADATQLAAALQFLKHPSHVLEAAHSFVEYKPEEMQLALDMIAPENMIVIHSSATHAEPTLEFESVWGYEVQYGVTHIDADVLAAWTDAGCGETKVKEHPILSVYPALMRAPPLPMVDWIPKGAMLESPSLPSASTDFFAKLKKRVKQKVSSSGVLVKKYFVSCTADPPVQVSYYELQQGERDGEVAAATPNVNSPTISSPNTGRPPQHPNHVASAEALRQLNARSLKAYQSSIEGMCRVYMTYPMCRASAACSATLYLVVELLQAELNSFCQDAVQHGATFVVRVASDSQCRLEIVCHGLAPVLPVFVEAAFSRLSSILQTWCTNPNGYGGSLNIPGYFVTCRAQAGTQILFDNAVPEQPVLNAQMKGRHLLAGESPHSAGSLMQCLSELKFSDLRGLLPIVLLCPSHIDVAVCGPSQHMIHCRAVADSLVQTFFPTLYELARQMPDSPHALSGIPLHDPKLRQTQTRLVPPVAMQGSKMQGSNPKRRPTATLVRSNGGCGSAQSSPFDVGFGDGGGGGGVGSSVPAAQKQRKAGRRSPTVHILYTPPQEGLRGEPSVAVMEVWCL